MMRWICMLSSCGLGACNGKLAVLTEEPVAEGQGGSSGAASSEPDVGAADEVAAGELEPLCSAWDLSGPHRLDESKECGSCGCFRIDRSLPRCGLPGSQHGPALHGRR